MIKVLVVDDNEDKIDAVRSAVIAGGATHDLTVEVARNASAARRALRATQYDLLLLDLVLPALDGQAADPGVGKLLLAELLAPDGDLRRPPHIVGLTAFATEMAASQSQFDGHLFRLVHYDEADDSWRDAVEAHTRHLCLARRGLAIAEYDFDIMFLCALDLEAAAVRGLPCKWKQTSLPGDHSFYWCGELSDIVPSRRTVLACSPHMGLPFAAAVAMKAIRSFRPRVVVMTGIMAGIRDRVGLGDVIVAEPAWDWSAGKLSTAAPMAQFAAAPYQVSLTPLAREVSRELCGTHVLLASIESESPFERPKNRPSAHMGPVASGPSVVDHSEVLEEICTQHRKLLGVDMETYALYIAAMESAEPRPVAVSAKAVSDFADGAKEDVYQRHAAYVSARFGLALSSAILDRQQTFGK